MNMEKQNEIISADPSITEAEIFAAARSSYAAGRIVEEATETIPQVMSSSSPRKNTIELFSMKFCLGILSRNGTVGEMQGIQGNEIVAVGRYSVEERKERVLRYLKKKNFNKIIKVSRRTKVLPLSSKDLKNNLCEQKDLNLKSFLRFARGGVLNISPHQHGILLTICVGFLSYHAKNSTTPFDFQFGKTTNTPQSLLSLEEAFFAFLPEITHITKFMLCYILTWMLILPLSSGIQIFLVLLLISAPLFYFPELVRKASASGVEVACGSFKLPLIGFATLGAVGLSLVCGLVTLLMVYLSWRFIYKGKPRVGEDEVYSDGLSQVLQR